MICITFNNRLTLFSKKQMHFMGDRNLSDDPKGDLFVMEILFLKVMWFSESKVGNLLRCLLNINANLEWHKTVRLARKKAEKKQIAICENQYRREIQYLQEQLKEVHKLRYENQELRKTILNFNKVKDENS